MMKLTTLLHSIFPQLLKEDGAKSVPDQAKDLGLANASFGRWKDPETGKVVAKSINGKLARVEPTTDTPTVGNNTTPPSTPSTPRTDGGNGGDDSDPSREQLSAQNLDGWYKSMLRDPEHGNSAKEDYAYYQSVKNDPEVVGAILTAEKEYRDGPHFEVVCDDHAGSPRVQVDSLETMVSFMTKWNGNWYPNEDALLQWNADNYDPYDGP